MRSQTELSAIVRQAMREKNIGENELANVLHVSSVMSDKILCGDVVPSRHLEKRLVEALGIPPRKVAQLASRRERQTKAGMTREAKGRKAA